MAEYRLSPRAQRDLEEVFDYTEREWGLAQALRYVDLIEAACLQLAEAPQLAQIALMFGPVIDGGAWSVTSSIFGRCHMGLQSFGYCISGWMLRGIFDVTRTMRFDSRDAMNGANS